jgi:hypothetical protein
VATARFSSEVASAAMARSPVSFEPEPEPDPEPDASFLELDES